MWCDINIFVQFLIFHQEGENHGRKQKRRKVESSGDVDSDEAGPLVLSDNDANVSGELDVGSDGNDEDVCTHCLVIMIIPMQEEAENEEEEYPPADPLVDSPVARPAAGIGGETHAPHQPVGDSSLLMASRPLLPPIP